MKDETGTFHIDPAELHRVYPPTVSTEQEQTPKESKGNSTNDGLIRELQTRLEAAQERLADKETVIADLREDRDKWRQQATALLADQISRPGFWARLIGKN